MPRNLKVATIGFKMENGGDTSDNNSVKNNSGSENGDDDCGNLGGNPKLADALNKVLRMAKNKPKNKSIVLSKAKLYRVNNEEKKVTCAFEIEPDPYSEGIKQEEDEDVKPEVKKVKKKVKEGIPRHERLKRGRIIPDVLDREKERKLSKIATKGVVQLFNAVRKQQSSIEKKFKETGLTETKREKILKSIDRKGFLDALSSCGNISLKMDVPEDEIKEEPKENEDEESFQIDTADKGGWKVLQNDFMMTAKLKDWDREEENELSS